VVGNDHMCMQSSRDVRTRAFPRTHIDYVFVATSAYTLLCICAFPDVSANVDNVACQFRSGFS